MNATILIVEDDLIIADLIDRGNLRTRVGTVLPLADAREAHFILEGRRPAPKGKIVLAPGVK